MGFLDKAKEAANQAMASAQQAAQQGQAKIEGMQQNRAEGELLRTLGDAFYNEQRRSGDREATIAALVAVDNYHATVAAQAANAQAAQSQPAQSQPAQGGADAPTAAQPAPAPAPAPTSTSTPPAGDFSLDDF